MFEAKTRRYAQAKREHQRRFTGQLPATTEATHGFGKVQPLGRPDLKVSKGAISAPPASVIALTRAGYGPRPGDIASFNALGASDSARMSAWVDQQLNHESINDSELNSRLTNDRYETLGHTATQLWQDVVAPDDVPWEDYVRPLWDLQRSTLMRAVYGKRQLFEVMAEFWHNHFSISADDFPIAPMMVPYDRDVIRPETLGNFRAMLEGVTRSVAMLYYLDNAYNSADGPNENYAREVLELHTLGVDNYYGYAEQSEVPNNNQGIKAGYTEDDVANFTRCLTGWSYDGALYEEMMTGDATFRFRSEWHDTGSKRVLGRNFDYSAGDPEADCLDVLDMLAAHPGTAGFVCSKLCRRLIGDDPPASVVSQAADVFQQHWQSPDQISRVVRVILNSNVFRTTWGDKVKRPYERIVSTMRACDSDFNMYYGQGDWDRPDYPREAQLSQWYHWEYSQTGHELFSWGPPNGFPDVKEVWQGSTPMVMTWRVLQMVVEFNDGDEDNRRYYHDIVGQTIDGLNEAARTPRQIAAFWFERILGFAPSDSRRDIFAKFMSFQDHRTPTEGSLTDVVDLTVDDWPAYNQTRLRAMAGLILMSPEFMRR